MPTIVCPDCETRYILKHGGKNRIKCSCGKTMKIKGILQGFERIEK